MIKVLIADDQPLYREGLKHILSKSSDIVVADEASNGEEILKKTAKSKYDVAIIDISLPDRSGFEILKQLRSMKPQLPILVLSVHPEDQYGIYVLKAGASGYLTKKVEPERLKKAIRKVYKGGLYISSSLAEKLVFYIENKGKKLPHELLSNREFEVICMITSGKTVKEIAEELSLSEKTIRTNRARILKKMKMKNNVELTHYAIKQGLVE